jgi:putative FmdB family regulatory protein
MPSYDMQCEACAYEFEAQASMKDGPPKKCPSCKKPKLRQVFQKPPAFHAHFSPMHPRRNRGRGW